MARIEVDENEWAERERIYQTAQKIGAHPKGRELLQEASALALGPEALGPEYHLRRAVDDRLSGIEKLLSEEREARAKEREERTADDTKRALELRWLEGRRALRDQGYIPEGIDKIEKFMEDNGIADHRIAAAAYERLNPPPEPVATSGSHWNFFDKATREAPDFSLLLAGDDEGFLSQAVPATLKEVRGG